MKAKLLIIACLLSSSVMAQNVSLKPDTAKTSLYGTQVISSGSSTPTLSINTIKGIQATNTWTFTTKNKALMIIMDQKPDSTYHVWFDKRLITWTSDSTFILKRKL